MCSILFADTYTNAVLLACFPAVPTAGKEETAETAPHASGKHPTCTPSSERGGKRLKICPARLVPVGKVPPAWLGVESGQFPKNLLPGANTLEASKPDRAGSPLPQHGGETGEDTAETSSKIAAVPVHNSPVASECTHPFLAWSFLVYFPSAHHHVPLMCIVALLFYGVQISYRRQTPLTKQNCCSSSPAFATKLGWFPCKMHS